MPVNEPVTHPVDSAGDTVGMTRRVLVDRLVHHLWTVVWMSRSRRLTCSDASTPCGRKKSGAKPWVRLLAR